MLPSEDHRAIYDVTFGRVAAGGAPHRECRKRSGSICRPSTRATGRPTRAEKQRMLDECCQVTGYHRKYVVRRLNGPAPSAPRRPRRRAATYGPALIDALAAIWEAAGYPWSVRLKALLPLWLPWARKRLRLTAALEAAAAHDQRPADRSPAGAAQAPAHAPALWPDQARHALEAPHPASRPITGT